MKVNELHQKQTKQQQIENLSFAEWMDYFSKEPTSKELDDMEREHKINPINNPINNPNYTNFKHGA